MSDTLIIIDKSLNIEIPMDKYPNELNALIQLKNGLISLYHTVRPVEVNIFNETKGQLLQLSGQHPLVPDNINNLLPCYFHWFGTSLCNYMRLTGFIVAREQGLITDADLQLEPEKSKIKLACDNYIKSIAEIQEILKWRNKVAAHFALTDPRKDDNIATLEASIIHPVAYDLDRFRTGTMIYTKGDDTGSHTSDIPYWSLTELFENLSYRFYPDVIFH
jgi:hypothetical protein